MIEEMDLGTEGVMEKEGIPKDTNVETEEVTPPTRLWLHRWTAKSDRIPRSELSREGRRGESLSQIRRGPLNDWDRSVDLNSVQEVPTKPKSQSAWDPCSTVVRREPHCLWIADSNREGMDPMNPTEIQSHERRANNQINPRDPQIKTRPRPVERRTPISTGGWCRELKGGWRVSDRDSGGKGGGWGEGEMVLPIQKLSLQPRDFQKTFDS